MSAIAPTAPSLRTLILAEPGLGHWSLCAWTRTYGPVLVTTWRDRTDSDNPPSPADFPRTDRVLDTARELCLVYARNGQEAWRQYGNAYRATRPHGRAA